MSRSIRRKLSLSQTFQQSNGLSPERSIEMPAASSKGMLSRARKYPGSAEPLDESVTIACVNAENGSSPAAR